jgi:antitoxin component of MazEF toxin-antitoxin module
MANRKTEDRGIRKLGKSGKTSLGVTLPIEMVRDLGWREKQKVVVTRVRGGLMIRDWKRR